MLSLRENGSYSCHLQKVFGKHDGTYLKGSRRRPNPEKSIQLLRNNKTSENNNISAIISYIIQHSGHDKRPYLKVTIFGIELLGLLDSGASRTVIGKQGWSLLQHLHLKVQDTPTNCKLANSSLCKSWGSCDVPMKLENKEKLIRVLLVEDIPDQLILGMDFWNAMEIIPHLHSNTWEFAADVSSISTFEDSETLLNVEQKSS